MKKAAKAKQKFNWTNKIFSFKESFVLLTTLVCSELSNLNLLDYTQRLDDRCKKAGKQNSEKTQKLFGNILILLKILNREKFLD